MKLVDENNSFEITLEYDGDGYPIVSINTGGGFKDEHGRPVVAVSLNGQAIHGMFSKDTIEELLAVHAHANGNFEIRMESDEYGKEEFSYDSLAGAQEGWQRLQKDVRKAQKEDGIGRELELVLLLTPEDEA